MTREERREHQKRGLELSERARKIAFNLAGAFNGNGQADLAKLMALEPEAKMFRDAYDEWWLQK